MSIEVVLSIVIISSMVSIIFHAIALTLFKGHLEVSLDDLNSRQSIELIAFLEKKEQERAMGTPYSKVKKVKQETPQAENRLNLEKKINPISISEEEQWRKEQEARNE